MRDAGGGERRRRLQRQRRRSSPPPSTYGFSDQVYTRHVDNWEDEVLRMRLFGEDTAHASEGESVGGSQRREEVGRQREAEKSGIDDWRPRGCDSSCNRVLERIRGPRERSRAAEPARSDRGGQQQRERSRTSGGNKEYVKPPEQAENSPVSL